MIPFYEALKIVTREAVRLKTERVPFTGAAGRVLAEDIFSDLNMPPFNKSAVDGFACRMEDLEMEMEILETIAAGSVPSFFISKGKASRIMTGAMVPEGADFVFMVEDSSVENNKVRYSGNAGNTNICTFGEDISRGDLILKKGTRLFPQHIACLAAVGAVLPLVSSRPGVGIISTGDELVEPDQLPEGAKIRNSNAFQLMAQVSGMGGLAGYYGIARDTEKDLQNKISSALETNEVVLLTGGVSMGDFDFVPKVMQDMGFEILFRSIAIQPGKPTVFAKKENQFIFGLPGNPVSSFVLFEMLVKPFLNAMTGNPADAEYMKIPAGKIFRRKKADRMGVIPVQVKNGKAFPVEYHGSAHINAYSAANGMAIMEPGINEIREGENLDVRQL